MRNLVIFCVTFFAVYFGSYYVVHSQDEEALPHYGTVEDFVLTDQRGKEVRFAETAGQPRVVSFFFTSCPHVCPKLQNNIKKIHKQYGTRITLLSISIDPERDTVDVLADYASKYEADYASWRFLRGKGEYLEGIMASLKLGNAGKAEDHTTRFVLIDQKGDIRGYYRGLEDEELPRLLSDLDRL